MNCRLLQAERWAATWPPTQSRYQEGTGASVARVARRQRANEFGQRTAIGGARSLLLIEMQNPSRETNPPLHSPAIDPEDRRSVASSPKGDTGLVMVIRRSRRPWYALRNGRHPRGSFLPIPIALMLCLAFTATLLTGIWVTG